MNFSKKNKMIIIKEEKLKTALCKCSKCTSSFSFEKEESENIYPTNYADLSEGYVTVKCPVCQKINFVDFKDFK